jgi:hypothetical protein
VATPSGPVATVKRSSQSSEVRYRPLPSSRPAQAGGSVATPDDQFGTEDERVSPAFPPDPTERSGGEPDRPLNNGIGRPRVDRPGRTMDDHPAPWMITLRG